MAWSVCKVLGSIAIAGLCGLVGCTGDKFQSCIPTRTCPSEPGEGGAAGAWGDADGSSGAGGTASASTSSSSESGGDSSSTDGNSSSGGSASGGATSGQGGTSADAGGAAGAPASCLDSCEFTCCDETCIDLESDAEHCGECGRGCTPDHGVGLCIEGSCAIAACDENRVDCNADFGDGCEVEAVSVPGIPSPLRPMLGAFTGSLHARLQAPTLEPTFEWSEVEAETCESVTYELEVDDSCPLTGFQGCEFATPEIDVSGIEGTSFTPSADLPVEEVALPLGTRYFWRVRACESRDYCSEWSDVLYLEVGRDKQDVTGDGYADLVGLTRADPQAGAPAQIFIARGKPSLGQDEGTAGAIVLAESVDPVVMAEHRAALNLSRLTFLGDVNGDGFNDVGTPGRYAEDVGMPYDIWLGGEDFGSEPPLTIVAPGTANDFPKLWSAGDFDRDGMADVLLALNSSPAGPPAEPWVALKRGGASLAEPVLTEDLVHQAEPPDPYTFVTGAATGDFNTDGLPDLALTVGPTGNDLYLISGVNAPNLEPQIVRTVAGTCRAIPAMINFNGDQFHDIPVLCQDPDALQVTFGTGHIFDSGVSTGKVGVWEAGLPYTHTDVAVGDLNGDGYDDFALSGGTTFAGGVRPVSDPVTEAEPPEMGSLIDQAIAIGDHDGDGRSDLVLGDLWYGARDGFFVSSAVQTASGPVDVVAWAK